MELAELEALAERNADWGAHGDDNLESLEGEIWRRVDTYNGESYEGRYAVSNYGRVKSFVRRGRKMRQAEGGEDHYQGHILATGANTSRAVSVNLRSSRGQKLINLARLLLTVFVGEPPTKKYVAAFKDGDARHVWLSNLYWAPRAHRKIPEDEQVALGASVEKKMQAFKAMVDSLSKKVEALQEENDSLRVGTSSTGLEMVQQRWWEMEERLEDAGVLDKELPVKTVLAKIKKYLFR